MCNKADSRVLGHLIMSTTPNFKSIGELPIYFSSMSQDHRVSFDGRMMNGYKYKVTGSTCLRGFNSFSSYSRRGR